MLFKTYLGEDDKKTSLTTGTVSNDDELSAKFRHDCGMYMGYAKGSGTGWE